MTHPAIPTTLSVTDPVVASILAPIKETLEVMNGTLSDPLQKVPQTADLALVISTLNQIIERISAAPT